MADAFRAFCWGVEQKEEIALRLDRENGSRFTMRPEDGGILAACVASCSGDHFEIGMLQGGSAILAAAAKAEFGQSGKIYGCDPFGWAKGQTQHGPEPSPETVLKNAALFAVENRIYPHRHAHPPLPPKLEGMRFDTCFIDGDHTYEGSRNDWELARTYTDKYVLFHDIHREDPGHMCRRVFLEACEEPGWEKFYEYGKMGVVRRVHSS